MKNSKKSFYFIFTLLITFILVAYITPKTNVFAKDSDGVQVLYNSSTFNIQGDKLNLIINSINIDHSFLLLDTYLFNNSKSAISSIKDFHLLLNDSGNSLVIDEIFPEIPLKDSLKEHSGVRLILTLPVEHAELDDKNFSNINYTFNYNYK